MWGRPKARPNGAARERARQEALLDSAEKMTPLIERFADHIADLPAEELAARVRAAMTLRPK